MGFWGQFSRGFWGILRGVSGDFSGGFRGSFGREGRGEKGSREKEGE